MKLRLILSLLTSLFFGLFQTNAVAQPTLKLQNIKNIVLIRKAGGLMNDFQKVEIVKENGLWQCYQRRLVTVSRKLEFINDSARIFINTIDKQTMVDFLERINVRDTTIAAEKFHIGTKDLINKIDSIIPGLSKGQKQQFIRGINTKSTLDSALYKVLHPRPLDDKTYYGIAITTIKGDVLKVTAYSFADLYDLPWSLSGFKLYDPQITLFFKNAIGDRTYNTQETARLIKDLLREIYASNFLVAFNWNDFKTNYPQSYKLFSSTLSPVNFYTHRDNSMVKDNYVSGLFKSTLLPDYIRIQSRFAYTDTAAILNLNNYERAINLVWKHNNFLFAYLRNRKDLKMLLGPENFNYRGERIFKEIAKYYPEIKSFDYKKSLLLSIYDNKKLDSNWILLSSNNLILLDYIGEQMPDGKTKFMNFIFKPTDNLSFNHLHSVCTIFNASGEIIKDNGQAFVSVG